MITKYTNVPMTRLKKVPYADEWLWGRTSVGMRALKQIGLCMNAGGTVSMRTDYDANGTELMSAELEWGPMQ